MIKKLALLLLTFIPLLAFTEPLNYNTDVFDLSRGKKNYKCHTAHINYKNLNGKFEKIDTTLTQDLDTKQWKQSKASYHCAIPEYADDWFEFYNAYEGANHTIKAKPVAGHIKGEAFSGKDGHGVIYKNAFGKGIDLKVYAYWHGLKKVIVINEKPAEIADMSFDFELQLPTNAKVKDKSNNEWNKSSKLDFKDKVLKIGDTGKESYFNPALMWDSNKLREKVNIELYAKDGKTYLRKTIPKEFLEKATYPVYTDHPTNYSPTVGDGYSGSNAHSWDVDHDATEGNETVYNLDYTMAYAWYNGSDDTNIYRAFVPIDTSGIEDGNTIDTALLYIYIFDKYNTDNDGDDWINVVQTSQSSTSSLSNADYDQCGSVNNPTEGATRIDITNITTSAYSSFTLNVTGISWINKTGVSMLGVREGHDCIDSPLQPDADSGIDFSISEDTSGTQDPYLDVTTGGGETQRRIIMVQ
jgi:hypothetical protein